MRGFVPSRGVSAPIKRVGFMACQLMKSRREGGGLSTKAVTAGWGCSPLQDRSRCPSSSADLLAAGEDIAIHLAGVLSLSLLHAPGIDRQTAERAPRTTSSSSFDTSGERRTAIMRRTRTSWHTAQSAQQTNPCSLGRFESICLKSEGKLVHGVQVSLLAVDVWRLFS